METPDYSHIWSDPQLANGVYEPAEDTFLLLDTLENILCKVEGPQLVLELGSGSGTVITAIAKMLPNAFCFATDLNPIAAGCTSLTARRNSVGPRIEVVVDNLATSLSHRLHQQFDLVVFNPPYVVTEKFVEGLQPSGIEASWAGGQKGREVIDRFLGLLPRLLTRKGAAYLVCLDKNDVHGLMSLAESSHGLGSVIVQQRRCGIEKLSVLKLFRNT